jgi:WD40 repeat protein
MVGDRWHGQPATRYRAFISYSHAADGKFAPALQNCLQRFARPWIRPWAIRVFRDQTDLGLNPDLWASVEDALSESQYFLLLASPEAAASKWVSREVQYWLSNRESATLLLILTSGELTWDISAGDFDWSASTALPQTLKHAFHEQPRHLDLRWAKAEDHLSLNHGRFRDSIAEIAATLHGKSKAEMESEGVRQAHRARRMAIGAVVGLTSLALSTALAAMLALNRAKIAEERRIEAVNAMNAAISQVLVNRSETFVPQPLDIGVLYGIEAMELVDSPATRANLLELVQAAPMLDGFLPETPFIRQMAFSPDGTRLATAGTLRVSNMGRGRIAMWDLETRSPVWVRSVDTEVVHLAFAPDGKTLLAVHATPALRRLDASDGSTLDVKPLAAPGAVPIDGWLSDHQMSQDGTVLVAKGKRDLMQWDLRSGAVQEIRLPGAENDPYVGALALGSGERKTLALAELNTLWLRELPDGSWREIQRLRRPGPIAVSAKGDAIGFVNGRSVFVWNKEARKTTFLFELTDEPTFLTWSQDGTRLAVGGKHGTVGVHFTQWAAHVPIIKLYGQESEILAMTFSPDGEWLTSVSRSGRIAVWAMQFPLIRIVDKEAIVMRPRLGTHGKRTPGEQGLALNAYGSLAVSKDSAGLIILSDLETGRKIASPKSVSGSDLRRLAAVSNDGSKIAVGEMGTASVMETKTGAGLGTIAGLWSIAFSEDGNQMATTMDRGVQLWSADSIAPLGDPVPIRRVNPVTHEPEGEPLWIRGAVLAFSRDGKWLAVGAGQDAYLVSLTDRSVKERIVVNLQGDEEIQSIALSPDNALLVTGMRDGSIMLWDRANAAAEGRLRGGHLYPVVALAFDREGSQLTSLAEDGSVVRWHVDPHYWIMAACRLVNRNLAIDERLPLIEGRPSDHSCSVTRTYLDLLLGATPQPPH